MHGAQMPFLDLETKPYSKTENPPTLPTFRAQVAIGNWQLGERGKDEMELVMSRDLDELALMRFDSLVAKGEIPYGPTQSERTEHDGFKVCA